jgi:hypothetical protein
VTDSIDPRQENENNRDEDVRREDERRAELEDMFGGNPRQEPQKPNEEFVFDENYYKQHSTAMRFAFFIMGCLANEMVVGISDKNAGDCSDFMCGVAIITECLTGNLIEDDLPKLPFDWRVD